VKDQGYVLLLSRLSVTLRLREELLALSARVVAVEDDFELRLAGLGVEGKRRDLDLELLGGSKGLVDALPVDGSGSEGIEGGENEEGGLGVLEVELGGE
jgi:hypothetical protein